MPYNQETTYCYIFNTEKQNKKPNWFHCALFVICTNGCFPDSVCFLGSDICQATKSLSQEIPRYQVL